jgi:hypothetical protein
VDVTLLLIIFVPLPRPPSTLSRTCPPPTPVFPLAFDVYGVTPGVECIPLISWCHASCVASFHAQIASVWNDGLQGRSGRRPRLHNRPLEGTPDVSSGPRGHSCHSSNSVPPSGLAQSSRQDMPARHCLALMRPTEPLCSRLHCRTRRQARSHTETSQSKR